MSTYTPHQSREAAATHCKVHANDGDDVVNGGMCTHLHLPAKDDAFNLMQWDLLSEWNTQAFDLQRRHSRASKFWGDLNGCFSMMLGILPIVAATCGSMNEGIGGFIAALVSFITSAVLAVSSRLQCAALSEAHHSSARQFFHFQTRLAKYKEERPHNLQRDKDDHGCVGEVIGQLAADFNEATHGAPLVSDGIFPKIPERLMCDECCCGICEHFLLFFHSYHVSKNSRQDEAAGFWQQTNRIMKEEEENIEAKCFAKDTEDSLLFELAHCEVNKEAAIRKAAQLQMLQRWTGLGLAFGSVFATAMYALSAVEADDCGSAIVVGNETFFAQDEAQEKLPSAVIGLEVNYPIAGAIVSVISALLAFAEKFGRWGQRIQQMHTLANQWSAIGREFHMAIWMQPHRNHTKSTQLTDRKVVFITDIIDRKMFFIEKTFITNADKQKQITKHQSARKKDTRSEASQTLEKIEEGQATGPGADADDEAAAAAPAATPPAAASGNKKIDF